MAYERYPSRDLPRDERARWRDGPYENRSRERGSSPGEERGFFDRACDDVASLFGDEEAERRRREDMRTGERERNSGRGAGRDWRGEDYAGGYFGTGREDERQRFREERSSRWTGRDYDHEHERGHWPTNREREREPGYRPVTGDYGRGSEQFFAASGYGRENFERARPPRERERSGREEFKRGGFETGREYDPHYRSWREQHLSDLDRDYAEYRREEQARFERDFSGWRERRMQKRALLDQIREHMEVIGSDDTHVGTIDCVAGDRIVLTKSDPDSGGVHHSLSCADIDRVEGDRVVLDLPAEQAKQQWRDESRQRALFERDDQGEMGPYALGRSFEGTYR